MKKLSVLALSILFTINIGGIWLIYEGEKLCHYLHEQKEQKSSGDREIIKLAVNEFARYKTRNNEIRLGDRMYDFSRIEIHGDSAWLYCIHDIREENLIALFNNFLKNQNSQEKDKLLSQIIELYQINYTLPDNPSGFNILTGSITFCESINLFKSIYLSTENPPPET